MITAGTLLSTETCKCLSSNHGCRFKIVADFTTSHAFIISGIISAGRVSSQQSFSLSRTCGAHSASTWLEKFETVVTALPFGVECWLRLWWLWDLVLTSLIRAALSFKTPFSAAELLLLSLWERLGPSFR